MPLVRIEIIKGRTARREEAAPRCSSWRLVKAFGIPDDDRTQRVVEHDPEYFEIPPGAGERYTLIEITAFPGRSATAKRRLYEAIVRNLARAGVPSTEISVVLHEPPMQNCGIQGGTPASEVDLGFRVDI